MSGEKQSRVVVVDRRMFLRISATGLAAVGLAACGAASRLTNPPDLPFIPGEATQQLPPTATAIVEKAPPLSTATVMASPTTSPRTAVPLPTAEPTRTPQPPLDLSPVALTGAMVRSYIATTEPLSAQQLEQRLKGRAFRDNKSGATILLSRTSCERLVADMAQSSAAALGYPPEQDYRRSTSNRATDGKAAAAILASQSSSVSPATQNAATEQFIRYLQDSEPYGLIAQYPDKHPALSAGSLAIIDYDQGQPFVLFPTANDKRSRGASGRSPQNACVASILAQKATAGVVQSDVLPIAFKGDRVAGSQLSYLWNDTIGRACAFDDYGVIAVYDVESSTWQPVPLDQDIPQSFGDRIRSTIKEMGRTLGVIRPDGTLNRQATVALTDAGGLPSVVLVLGGRDGSPCGLSPDRPYVEWVKSAFSRLNEVDPDITRTMVSYGVRSIAADVPPKDFYNEREKSWAATFNVNLGIIEINEKADDTVQGVANVMTTLLLEARDIGFRRGLVNKLDANQGVDKGLFVKQWADAHKEKLGNSAYYQLVDRANYTIAWYKQNLP